MVQQLRAEVRQQLAQHGQNIDDFPIDTGTKADVEPIGARRCDIKLHTPAANPNDGELPLGAIFDAPTFGAQLW